MAAPTPSPFLAIPTEEWLCANSLAFAILDRYPVSPGHVLVITRRVVPTYFECSADEQAALMALAAEAKQLLGERLDPKPDGYNVGFNAGTAAGQTVSHVHVHVIPRYSGDMPDPRGGVRHVIPEKGNYLAGPAPAAPVFSPSPAAAPRLSLTTGPERPLWKCLADRLRGASEIDLLASFVQRSGLDVVGKSLFQARAAGARIRLLVGDYLGITDPEALRLLLGWMQDSGPSFESRLAELDRLRGAPHSFHPKAWRIADASGGIVVVGSSFLSRAALETGIEWNLVGETSGSGVIDRELLAAFDDLWQQATPLTADVIDRYAARAARSAIGRVWDGEADGPAMADGEPAAVKIRAWQRRALDSLAVIRAEGYSKALVAVATGMGKTKLAAFDAVAVGKTLGRMPRVLVIAHRVEILAQAESSLRGALGVAASAEGWPAPSVSWFSGSASDLSGSLVIASIQKLSNAGGLAALAAAEPFDFAIIDEVHHAEAPSYRRVLARLRSAFTLGLTATPERTDGVDVATLFDDILAYQATIGDGITEEILVPFRYRGLKDDVDYDSSKIPWRNGRFDVGALETALENSDRMERLWAEWQSAPASRTLVFCCSRRHALFARDWLRKRGVSAAAVFSESRDGPATDPRMESLAAFVEGRLETLCVVDLFNEGIDIPLVDRVVMLRPTESKVVFVQQLGRGLRSADGKTRLDVIDFVGNHRVFASRIAHLLALAPRGDAADATLFGPLRSWLTGAEPELPPGCVLDVDLEAKTLLDRFLPRGRSEAVDAYRLMRAELGRRPTPSEFLEAGYVPKVVGVEHGSWFGFVKAEGDLSEEESRAFAAYESWLVMLQSTSLNKSYKMVVLRVLLDRDAFWSGMEIPDLAAACRSFLENHPALRVDLEGAGFTRDSEDPAAERKHFADWWLEWPLSRWLAEQGGRRWFERNRDRFVAAGACPPDLREAFETLSSEMVDYRLANYTHRSITVPRSE
jgi:superfamily II DNA or RNA helicase/diadenosine tetraphosphate (Ap4A) HIT family hydrolase/HKD family nuclease